MTHFKREFFRSYLTEHIHNRGLVIISSGVYQQELESYIYIKTGMCMFIESCCICGNMKTTEMSSDGWLHKQIIHYAKQQFISK